MTCAPPRLRFVPSGLVDQATPEGVRALQGVGMSVHTFALLNVVVDKDFQLVWFAVGAIIFWRRSDESMALLVADGLLRAGRAGSRSCSPLFKLAEFSSPSCTLVRPPWRWSHSWCSWGSW